MVKLLSWLFLCLALSNAVHAQTGSGQISGTVTDPSRAIVAKARVLAFEIRTSSARKTLTNEYGFYSFSELQPGDYDLSIQVPGFAQFVVRAHVTVGARIAIDPILSLSPVQTQVTVVGEGGVQVETQTQRLSEVVNGLQITELPTLTRNPYDLVALAGNVSPGDPGGYGVGAAINGQRAASTNITLDGAENTNSYFATIGQSVPLDSVREFRISQSTFTAEYGRASGGMVDVETRSGTNNVHGSVYEFNRVSVLAANTFDNNARNIPRGNFTRNQFGYAIGGPILERRLFFFQSTEWTRVRSHQTMVALVPTPEFIEASAPATIAYFKMFAGAANPINGAVYTKANLLATGIVANPGGPFDALPAGTPILGTTSYRTSIDAGGGDPQNSYSSVTRLDFNLSDDTKIFGRFALEKEALPALSFSSPYPDYAESFSVLNKNALFDLTHVFSSTLVGETKLGFDRLDQQYPLGTAPPGPALQFPGGFNVFGIAVTLPGYANSPGGLTEYEWQLYQDLTWTSGKHQLHAGGQFLHTRNNATDLVGTLATEQLGIQTADSLDNFLLGQVHEFTVAINPEGKFPCFQTPVGQPIQTPACTLTLPLQSLNQVHTTFNRNGAAYVQDTWHTYKSLTLNLGLRWEYYGVQYTDNQNFASNFYLGSGSNFAEQIRNGQVLTVPDSPTHGLWRPDYKNFGPRVGFAWDLFGDGKTSLRGGYGISYEGNFGRVYRNLSLNPPSYAVADLLAGTPQRPTIAISTQNLGPFAANSGTLVYPTDSPAFQVVANIKTAYAETWSFSFDRQLLPNTVASLAYSGSHGVHLYSNTPTDIPGSGVIYGGENPNVNPLSTLNRQYEEIFTRANGAFSGYNALLVRVQGQNVKNTGLTFTANYTFSHTIDNVSSTLSYFPDQANFGFLDFLNPTLDRGDAEFDIRHNFVTSMIWQEPFFRSPTSRWRHLVLGGWTLSSIYVALTGTPFSVYDCTFANVVCPRYIPSTPVASSGHAVDTGQPNFFEYIPLPPAVPYANPLIGISDFGNCALVPEPPCPFPANMTSRDFFRGPGIWSLDLGIYKNFQPHEGWVLQVRGELFNAFNHPNLQVNTGQAEISFNPEFISAQESGNRNVQLALKLTF